MPTTEDFGLALPSWLLNLRRREVVTKIQSSVDTQGDYIFGIHRDEVFAGGLEDKPRWNHAIVDEGQDLPQNFFRYLNEHAAKVLTVFADEDQALGDRKTTLNEIRVGGNLPHPILLRENHRNRPEIAALAEHFHSGLLPAATLRRAPIGQRPRLIKKDSIGDAAEFIAT